MNKNNRGSVTLEAMLIIPFFIFGMLAIYDMGQSAIAEAFVYEAAAETVEYMAEYGYISEPDFSLPYIVFEDYLDDKTVVEKYIKNGVSGVDFLGTYFSEREESVVLVVNYTKQISLPFMPCLMKEKSFSIKQRAYVGNVRITDENEQNYETDTKVYVAENESVYHKDVECTHLKLTITSTDMQAVSSLEYSSCQLCGNDYSDKVYITSTGTHYHSSINCSGLKRTVYEIDITDTNGLMPCSRCGGQDE